jgi:hypothetical protein
MGMILDTQIVELRNVIMKVVEIESEGVDGISPANRSDYGKLFARAAEAIDNLREYCFAKDREVEYWQEKHKLEGEAMGSEIQREVNKSRCLNDALQISKAEVVRLRAENNELAQDKEVYRQMTQHFIDEH